MFGIPFWKTFEWESEGDTESVTDKILTDIEKEPIGSARRVAKEQYLQEYLEERKISNWKN